MYLHCHYLLHLEHQMFLEYLGILLLANLVYLEQLVNLVYLVCLEQLAYLVYLVYLEQLVILVYLVYPVYLDFL